MQTPANFATAFNHADFLKILRREEGRSTEVFIGHYRAKYTSETDLPVWMATELIGFGALSKMCKHFRTGFRERIAREMPLAFKPWATLVLRQVLCSITGCDAHRHPGQPSGNEASLQRPAAAG